MTNTSLDPKKEQGDQKVQLQLLPPEFLVQVARALGHGAKKYGVRNWHLGKVECQTYLGAMLRHLMAWQDGEDLDRDSRVSHLAHVAASVAILLDAAKVGTLVDNRPPDVKRKDRVISECCGYPIKPYPHAKTGFNCGNCFQPVFSDGKTP